MGGSSHQLWLTAVVSDDEVESALTLCFSLKRVNSSRMVGVLLSQTLSGEGKRALRHVFDLLFYINEEDQQRTGLGAAEMAKLSVFSLKSFEKVVYFSPTMIILRNCDEMFKEHQGLNRLALLEDKGLDIFVARPSLQSYMTGVETLSGGGTGLEEYLRSLASLEEDRFIPTKYCSNFPSEEGTFLGNQDDIFIINLLKQPTDTSQGADLGLIEMMIRNLQNSIYENQVRPLLNAAKNGTTCGAKELGAGRTANNPEPIAIIGMSCRLPGANTPSEFWELLIEGKDATGNPPNFRWLPEESVNSGPQYRQTNAGFLKGPVNSFDARFFGLSPVEVNLLDPQHRLLLELVWESLEDAAINPQSLRGSQSGVFLGSWTTNYLDIVRAAGFSEFYRNYMGNSIGAAAARIAFMLGLTGPNIATESACSSSMSAVHLACRSLQREETGGVALACGVNLTLEPFGKDYLPGILSDDGHCKTFDISANGYARAEGAGVLVLKRYSEAVKDGDRIWGLVKGCGMAQEGLSQSMGTPTVHSESLAMKHALADAGVDPALVSYVETHGTGTAVGDPLEVAAIAKAYYSNGRKDPLLIGSVKTNVGHTESCSGITGIVKVVLAMHHEMIPPHRNFTTLNPTVNLNAIPAVIPLQPTNWARINGVPRYAGVSSFGITGLDTHVILEEVPLQLPSAFNLKNVMERPLHIMKLSAKSDEALQLLLQNYVSFLSNPAGDESFGNIAFTANTGRADFSFRAVINASSKAEAVENIKSGRILKGSDSSVGKLCFLFTGQGSQYPGMGKELYETCPTFRIHFDHVALIFKKGYKIDINQALWGDESAQLSRTIYSQPSIFCLEYALFNLWQSWGIKPDIVLGHSLGEFAAAVCAGILGVKDAVKLVAERSRLIESLPPGKMLVIKADKARVDKLLSDFAEGDPNWILEYAALNSPEQTVVAGDSELVDEFAKHCQQTELKCLVLEATHAFHSKHMDPILDDYRKVAKTVKPGEADTVAPQFISGLRGSLLEAPDLNADYWVEHTRENVKFLEASRKAIELGCRTFIEIGPHPVLTALTMLNSEPTTQIKCLPSLTRSGNGWKPLLNTLAQLYLKGVKVDWQKFDQFYERKKVSLPTYPFIRKKFWPELPTTETADSHPLLGNSIPNATPVTLLQSQLSLKRVEWIGDHKIGANVLFPGACYLEMALAAGVKASNSLNGSYKIENLMIEAPLGCEPRKSYTLQTILNENEEGDGLSIEFFSGESNNWTRHAVASFSFLNPINQEIKLGQLDASSFLQSLSLLPSSPTDDFTVVDGQQLYDKFNSSGFKFGPAFKTVEKLWTEKSGKNVLAKIKNEHNEKNGYILHPLILDAMLQLLVFVRSDQKLNYLLLPVKINKFLLLSEVERDDELYVYMRMESSQDSEQSVLLVNSGGKVRATMSSVEMVRTSQKALESVLDQQTNVMPGLWKEVWKPNPNSIPETSQQSLSWLIFHSKDSPLSNLIVEKLKDEGTDVILVEAGENFEKKLEGTRTTILMRKNEEGDYKLLWNMVASRPKALERIVFCWSLADTQEEQLLRSLFWMSKGLLQSPQFSDGEFPQVFVVTKERAVAAYMKSLKHENLDLDCRCIIVGIDQGMEQVFEEIWSPHPDPEILVSFDESGTRQVPRMEVHSPLNRSLPIPRASEGFQLLIPATKSIADLKFIPLSTRELGPTQVEVEVKASALNFRDVLSVLKPSAEFSNCNSVGLDFAGLVRRVGTSVKKWGEGDPVFGFNSDVYSAPFLSRQIIDENEVLALPSTMTFSEAATLPNVFVTAYYCLIRVAKIKPTDVVLIHTASGGVGLCSLQLCKLIGCTVVVTAGNKRKRGYWRSQGLNESHIFSSRTTDYEAAIKKVTNGRGVDVVLNSLTSEGFKEATLGACAHGARFVEMSKLSIWSPTEVQALRPDVNYSVVDISQMDPVERQGVFAELEPLLKRKTVNALAFVRFDGVNIKDALEFLQQAKQIGKVVCIMPQVENRDIYTPLFNERSSYFITGGLGGIGFVVCQWMIENGAKFVILAGRSPPSSETEAAIQGMNLKGAQVTTVQLDMSNSEQVGKFFKEGFETKGLPPLRGIMHAAGTLIDALIVNHDWNSFSQPFAAKKEGTINLHEFSKGLNLEHFVLFSSIASLFGSKGQANYAAGNGFEDNFAHYRHSIGLPATTINWGPWSQVGFGVDADFPGIKPISNLQGIKALDYVLRSNQTQLAVWNLDSVSSFHKSFPGLTSYLTVEEKSVKNAEGSVTQTDFWEAYAATESQSEKLSLVKENLVEILRGILQLPKTEVFEDSLTFQEMGLDSLMFVELSNSLHSVFGRRSKMTFRANWVKENNKLGSLSQAILESIGQSETPQSDTEQQQLVNALIRKDSQLPLHISSKKDQVVGNVREIESVLLLGATGSLGPYLLHSLTQLPQVKEVICLIRKGGIERLQNVLQELDLYSKVDLRKVRCVTGDISLPHLGMNPELWDELCGSVDAIVNSAVAIDHMEIYKEAATCRARVVNVQGTKNVLEFSVEGKLKRVFHATTLLAAPNVVDDDGTFGECWPNVEDFDNVTTMAYNVSKFVGELVIKEAVERGIPCSVFRFPFISGHSETGRMSLQTNHLMQRYIFVLKNGIMPSNQRPLPLLPVDICADLSIRIFFHEKNDSSGVFNITHPNVDLDQDFVKVAAKFGATVNLVEEAEFSNALQNLTPATSNFALFKDFYTSGNFILNTAPVLKGWRQGNENYFVSKNVSKLLPNAFREGVTTMDFVHKDMQFAKEHGWLD